MSFGVRVSGGDMPSFAADDPFSMLPSAPASRFPIPAEGVCRACEGSLVAGEVRVRSRQMTGKAVPCSCVRRGHARMWR
jgi:hypothetical protein